MKLRLPQALLAALLVAATTSQAVTVTSVNGVNMATATAKTYTDGTNTCTVTAVDATTGMVTFTGMGYNGTNNKSWIPGH